MYRGKFEIKWSNLQFQKNRTRFRNLFSTATDVSLPVRVSRSGVQVGLVS